MTTTTRTAIQTANGLTHQLILLIEGYSNAITDGPTALAVSALAGTEWTAAIGGLQVQWDWEQRFDPWDEDVIQVDGLSFAVMDEDNTDTFGIAVFGSDAGAKTRLTASLPAHDAVGVVQVQSTSAFASSGTVHIGTEAISYTGKTSTTFTGCTRGRYSPFKANTETASRYGREHQLQLIGDGQGTTFQTKVTSVPSVWKGRGVAIWIHRNVGGTLDLQAEAQCVWQGRIRDVRDSSSGLTIVDCDDYRSKLKETVLLGDQFSFKAREGLWLKTGWQFNASDLKSGTQYTANPLKVVAGTPSGPNQIATGYVTLDQLADALNQWWEAERTAGRLGHVWNWSSLVDTTEGRRSVFRWTSGGSGLNWTKFKTPHKDVQAFMGWTGVNFASPNSELWGWDGTGAEDAISPETPFRTYLPQQQAWYVKIDDVRGSLFNNQPFWPPEAGNQTTAGTYAIMQVNGGPIAVFSKIDDETFQFGHSNDFLDEIAGVAWDSDPVLADTNWYRAIRADQDGEIRFKQIALISGKLSTVLSKLFASTGTTGYNHATYDAYPAQLGAAIPWGLLGSTWTQSVGNLAESHGTGHGSVLLVIEKPTRLTEVIACELRARLSTIVLKDAAFKIATWGTPLAAQATHSLTVGNKASPADARDDQVTVCNETSEALVNVIKIEYNRDLKGGYKDVVIIRHQASISELGTEKAYTIKMRNTFGARASTSESVDELVDGLIGAISMFAYPLRVLKRTIDMSLFEGIAPGDFGTISDDFARDPTTGERGLSSKAHLLLSHRVDWGGYEMDSDNVRPPVAEVEVLILPVTSIAAYCPCAEIDDTANTGGYTGGYNGGSSIALYEHVHSLSSETADALRFNNGDAVEVIQVDADDPDAPLRWTANIDEVADSTHITLDAPLTGFDSTKRYRIRSRSYSSAVTVQRANVYQADDADGMIEDLANPYVYGQAQQAGDWESEADDGTELPALYSSYAFGDGVAFDTGYEMDAARLANNLASYRTAICLNTMSRTVSAAGTGSFTRKVISVIPINIGPFALGSTQRYIRARPFLRRGAAGGYVKLWATLCRRRPLGYSFTTTDDNDPQYTLVGPMSGTGWWETASTSWASHTLGYLDFSIGVLDPLTGGGFLVLEAEPNVEIRGLSMLQLMPITTP